MTGYLLLLLSNIALSIDFCLDKQYQRIAGNSVSSGLRYNILWGAISTVLFYIINGFKFTVTPFSLMTAIIFASGVLAYKVIGLTILKTGGISLHTMFLMTGGMMVPYVFGLIFLHEEFKLIQFIGLIAVIAAVILVYYGSVKFSKTLLILCVAVFLLNGTTSVISKIHQIEEVIPTISTLELVTLSALIRSVASAVVYPFASKAENDKKPIPKKGILIIVASAFVGGVAYTINFAAAAFLPATVVYPMITGGTILFSILADRIVFKNKITRKSAIGIVLCMAGLIMFI